MLKIDLLRSMIDYRSRCRIAYERYTSLFDAADNASKRGDEEEARMLYAQANMAFESYEYTAGLRSEEI